MKKQITRNWWIFTLNGLIAIFYGLLALFAPEETTVIIAKYSGLVILLSGLIMLAVAVNRIRQNLPYGVLLTQSIIAIVLGSLIVIYTQQTISFFITMLGLWAILIAVLLLVILVNLGNDLANKNMLLVNALFSLIFGVILLINPYNSAQALVIISGILALGFGVILIWFSVQLRHLGKSVDTFGKMDGF